MKTILSALAAGICFAAQSAQITVPGLFPTGVDDSGNLLPMHAVDTHYSLSDTRYVVPVGDNWNQWTPISEGAQWIGPHTTDDPYYTVPAGWYSYTTQIDLTGISLARFEFGGHIGADSLCRISVNGYDSGWPGAASFDFVLSDDWVPGINTITFSVWNEPNVMPNPSGLMVGNLVAVDDGSLPHNFLHIHYVPENGTSAALLLMSLGLFGAHRVMVRCKPFRP